MFKGNKNNKQTKRSKGDGGALMQQMGIQMPNFDEPNIGGDDDDVDDEELLAELQQISGGQTSKRTKPNPKKSGGSSQNLQSFHNDVNKLLNDIDRPINDDELSDVDDDDLLAELHEIAGDIESETQNERVEIKQAPSTANNNNMLSVLETRREMYTKAVQTAKTSGDASKARRLDRQLKVIQELLQSARTGAPINEGDIPPALFSADTAPQSSQPTVVSQEIPIRAPSPPPPPPQPTKVSLPTNDKPVVSQPPAPVSTATNVDEDIARLKALALKAKTEGDMVKAKEYLIQAKNLQSGATTASASIPPTFVPKETHDTMPEDDNSAPPSMPLTAPEPRTVMEALQQRHEELAKRLQDANNKGESSKARRMDRLVKQYQEAIDATRKGRPYDYSELPDLPGFAPIPVQQSKPQPPPPPPPAAKPPQSTTQARPSQSQQPKPNPPTVPIPQPASKPSTNIREDQQTQSLRLKQEQLKKLALEAKQKGDIETAKKYLISMKEPEQNAASIQSDVVIDTNPIPESPNEDYEMIRDSELTEELASSDRETIYRRLQDDLLRQMQLCARNQQMYAQMEGANNAKQANEYKILEQRCAQDIERLRKCFQHGLKPPVFHYAKRQMNIIQVNNDLTDNELEVNVFRGINLQVPTGYSPTSLETYVIIEFPYPPETPQTARTRHGTGTSNAEYSDSLHKFHIKRNEQKFKRLMTRKDLKLNIYYKAGFLRSDRLLGTASVKLSALEQTATIHESVNVYENDHKKKPEGKLEVKIRIKEALGQTKSSESSSQRWLVIDRFEDIPHNSQPSSTKSTSTAPSITAISHLIPTGDALGLLAINLAGKKTNIDTVVDSRRSSNVESNKDSPRNSQQPTGPQSIQVLKFEAELLQEQIVQLEDHLTPDQIDQLRMKHKVLLEQSEQIVKNLRQGGKQSVQEHVQSLEELVKRYNQEEDDCRQRNDIKKADLLLKKKNLVQQEIETFTLPVTESNEF